MSSLVTRCIVSPLLLRWPCRNHSVWRRTLNTHHVISRRCINTSSIVCNPVIPFNLPDVGEAIMTVIITEWLVKPGDTVSMGDPICEVQSDKSSATIYCPYDGTVDKLMYAVDETAKKDEPLVMINVDDDTSAPQTSTKPGATPTATPTKPTPIESSGSATVVDSSKVLATPAVRKIAMENNINISNVVGTGKDNRVLKEDILNYLERLNAPKVMKPPPPPLDTPTAPPPSATDYVESVKGYKTIMVQTMTRSGQIPQFGYCDEVEMSELSRVRSHIRASLADKGIKVSYMPLMIKAISLALKEYPILNSHVNEDCTKITYKADHNIGIAMDTPLGLVVPNVKQVQTKSILQITQDLNRIHELGLKGQLSPSEITGGTFSLSNIGAIGGTYTRPMVLPPEVCIGAFGKIQEVAMVNGNGGVRSSSIMYVSWSADHRVIDGATVAKFSNLWKSYLEYPETMLMNLQ